MREVMTNSDTGAKPHRVQLSRKKGWRMPANTVSVARPGRWGNRFRVGDDVPGSPGEPMDALDAVHSFQLFQAPDLPVADLRGKNLACWCPLSSPCHADVLLELANAAPPRQETPPMDEQSNREQQAREVLVGKVGKTWLAEADEYGTSSVIIAAMLEYATLTTLADGIAVGEDSGRDFAASRLGVMCDHGRIDAAYGDFSHPALTMIADVRKVLAASPPSTPEEPAIPAGMKRWTGELTDEAVERAARYVLDNSRRGNASLNDEQFAADTASLMTAYRDIIRKAWASDALPKPAPIDQDTASSTSGLTDGGKALRKEWEAIRPLMTGLISDVECAIHYDDGVDALSSEAPDEARAGIERMDKLISGIATQADMAAFGASDAACYLYPGEGQQPERAAFCAGAAHTVGTPALAQPDAVTSGMPDRGEG